MKKTIIITCSAFLSLSFFASVKAINLPVTQLPSKTDIGIKAAQVALTALKADTTVTRVALVNNTNSNKTFTLGGDRPATLAPGQMHVWKDPIFKPDASGKMRSSILCTDNGDRAVLFWEERSRVKYRYIRFESGGNTTPFYFAAYGNNWETKGSYQSGKWTTYTTYWLNDHGNVWAWGSMMVNDAKITSKPHQFKDKQPDNRQGIIVYYGNDRPLPDAGKVTIVESGA